MKYGDQRIYRTFEEFEREELRRADGFSPGMDQMLDELFADEPGPRAARRPRDNETNEADEVEEDDEG
jgi:hypothetical protein